VGCSGWCPIVPKSVQSQIASLDASNQNKTFSRPQLSLKFVHTKGSVRQLLNIKEYTVVFKLQ